MALPEPVTEVTATVPDSALGGVLGDLAARRGRVAGSVAEPGGTVATATVPPGGAVRLRDPAAQPHPGPRRRHHPPGRIRPAPVRQ